MRRFFAEISGDKVYITKDDAHHIANVLRLSIGESIICCDGKGNDYVTTICEITKTTVEGRVVEKMPSKGEPPVKVTIYQGIPKGDKFEFIIQKAVELGVYKVVPVETMRSIVKIENNKKKSKTERWNKISNSAAKQSGRGCIPTVCPPVSFKEGAELFKRHELSVIAYEDETVIGLKSVLQSHKDVCDIGVFIGPEGGIDETEFEVLKNNGAVSASLGNRIMRTETASVAVLSMIMYEYE